MLDRRLQLLSWAMSSQIVLTEEHQENARPSSTTSQLGHVVSNRFD